MKQAEFCYTIIWFLVHIRRIRRFLPLDEFNEFNTPQPETPQNPPVVRHRRSDRHRAPGEAPAEAKAPVQPPVPPKETENDVQWERRQPDSVPGDSGFVPPAAPHIRFSEEPPIAPPPPRTNTRPLVKGSHFTPAPRPEDEKPPIAPPPPRTTAPLKGEGAPFTPPPARSTAQPKGEDLPFTPPPRTNVRPPESEDGFSRRPVALNENGGDDEYEDEDTPRVWPRVLIAVLLILVLCGVALFFLPDVGPLQPVKDAVMGLFTSDAKKAPAQVVSFQAQSAMGVTGGRIRFQMTTNSAAENVRLEDAEGHEIPSAASLINGQDETNKIWEITATFSSPYSGEIYAAVSDGTDWARSDKAVTLRITEPTEAPTEAPTETPPPTEAPTEAPTEVPTEPPTEAPATENPVEEQPAVVDETPVSEAPAVVPTWAPQVTAAPATEVPTEVPVTDTPAPTDTPEPTAEPTAVPTPTPSPTPSPLPRLTAESAAEGLKVTDTVFKGGKTQSDFQRENGYLAPNPDAYTFYEAGIFTFRGDNFRRNAAFGTADVQSGTLSVLWQSEIGSMRTADSGTLYGVGWTGQPAIVKWTIQSRNMMNLYEDKKNTSALREVIFGAQDGKIYFLDLTDGTPTRDPINVGYPLKGSVSLDTYGRPLLAVGQGISKLTNKTGDIGLHVYNLINGERFFLLNGRQSDSQKQYSTNGAFDGTALFLHRSEAAKNDALIVAGENGLLYTVDLNSEFKYPTNEDPSIEGALTLNRDTTYLRTKADAEKDNLVSVESSVAMYDKYVYMADAYGVVRCVDTDTMQTVWAVDCGDNTDAAIALDMEGDTGVSLYTGNTAYSRLGSKNNVTIRKLNALTGEEIWNYQIKCDYDKLQLSGCKASPVIGQNNIADLVIFTVSEVTEGGSRVIAFNKDTGAVVWSFDMATAETVSSPVAVYNDAGDAWIIQAEGNGVLHMLDARTGAERTSLDLGGDIQGSPAVFRNILVIGTCSKDNARMYGIQIN